MDAAGSCPVILLHTRRELQEAVTDGPILVLDATMPVRIVQYFLPRLKVLADVQAAAPFLDTFQIVGGWGKTSSSRPRGPRGRKHPAGRDAAGAARLRGPPRRRQRPGGHL